MVALGVVQGAAMEAYYAIGEAVGNPKDDAREIISDLDLRETETRRKKSYRITRVLLGETNYTKEEKKDEEHRLLAGSIYSAIYQRAWEYIPENETDKRRRKNIAKTMYRKILTEMKAQLRF